MLLRIVCTTRVWCVYDVCVMYKCKIFEKKKLYIMLDVTVNTIVPLRLRGYEFVVGFNIPYTLHGMFFGASFRTTFAALFWVSFASFLFGRPIARFGFVFLSCLASCFCFSLRTTASSFCSAFFLATRSTRTSCASTFTGSALSGASFASSFTGTTSGATRTSF